MSSTSILPIVAAVGFVLVTIRAITRDGAPTAGAWKAPAILSLAFFLFSLEAVVSEGPLGFWPEHTHNLWGNQIWFDLLLAVGIAWTFVLPHARAVGMRVGVWLALIISSGSVGFLAMVARLLYLREQAANAGPLRG